MTGAATGAKRSVRGQTGFGWPTGPDYNSPRMMRPLLTIRTGRPSGV